MSWGKHTPVVYAGLIGLLTWEHLHGPARWIALAIGVLGVAVTYVTTFRDFRAEWRSPGVEHHELERAGFITFVVGIVGLYAYAVICHWAHWRPVGPMWFVAIGAYVFVISRYLVYRALTR